MKTLKLWMSSLIGFASLLPFGAFADDQFDLALPGIAGTDSVAGLTDLIPVYFYFFGSTGSTLFVEKPVDAVSPLLEQAVAEAQHFGSATLYDFVLEGGAAPQLATTFTFSNVTAESFQLFSPDGGIPEDRIGFAFQSMSVSAVPEPATVWLMLAGLGGLGFVARRGGSKVFA